MTARLRYPVVVPKAFEAMQALEGYVRGCGLEHPLLELMKVRASQINGCAYCIDMHWKDARAAGETEERLYMLSAWREATVYTARERAALAVAEEVTRIGEHGVSDAVYEAARAQFSEAELVNVVMALVAINGWNRLAITFRSEPGKYQPRAHAKPSGGS